LFDVLNQIGKITRNQPSKPFGGIQLIFSGDFYQLPPIKKNEEFLKKVKQVNKKIKENSKKVNEINKKMKNSKRKEKKVIRN
jgi:hypothetical protein